MRHWLKAVTLFAILVGLAGFGAVSNARTPASGAPTGTITGVVTANRSWALSEASGEHIPALVAVRVRAHDVARHIYYTVFTKDARYHIYNLPPGTYRLAALKDSFDSSTPTVTVQAGETVTANLKLIAMPNFHLRAKLGDFDFVFPPSPARTYLLHQCMGCHGWEHIPYQRMPGGNFAQWAVRVSNMFNTWGTTRYTGVAQVNPAAIPQAKRAEIIRYFAKIFPVGGEKRDFKLADLPLNENALSKAVYIEYEEPPARPGHDRSNHDVWPSRLTHTVYVSEMGNDAVLALDTQRIDWAGRWHTYVLPNPDVEFNRLAPKGVAEPGMPWRAVDAPFRAIGPHGITQAPDGLVYTADIAGSSIGQLNPVTGVVHEYPTPTRSTPHTIAYAPDGTIWFTEMQGKSLIGEFDPKTRKITEYDPDPKKANAHYYGLNIDKEGRVWAVGMTSHELVEYDPKTRKWYDWPTPTQPSGTRRVSIAPNGMVWVAEHIGGHLGMFNPNTHKWTEYKNPYPYFGLYAVMAGRRGDIWVTLRSYGVIARFDPRTKKYTYYPEPFPDIMGREHPGAHGTGLAGLYPPRIEQGPDGTIWFSGIGYHYLGAFKPYGNVPRGRAEGK